MKVIRLSVLALFILISTLVTAQEITQSIRGRIVDVDSEVPAIGATVVIQESDPFNGAATDIDGYFKLVNVPLGRVTLEITYIGYEKKIIPNVLVTSAKEVFLTVAIVESVNEMETFVVTGNNKHDEPIDEMAIISSRTFSTEETKRYAGSLNDPARMASNFAGVSSNAEGSNDIVVRGNSPRGILWRMEGIEIPNPNHFADEGASGGPINVLNSKMLSNSGFLTGAFAPEYGNATSGVFDIKLRQGNNEQREYSFGLGVYGADIALEGPIKKGGKASYLVNYRYSSLGILDDLGVVDFNGVPKYQDVSFNFYLPTKKAGIFKLFGMGGISNIAVEETFDVDNDSLVGKGDHGAHLGFVGLSHSYIFNAKTYLKSSLSLGNNGSDHTMERRISDNEYQLDGIAKFEKYNLKAATSLNKKLNAKNKITAGAIYTDMTYTFDFSDRQLNNEFEPIYDVSENAAYMQFHSTWKHRFNENVTLVAGAHYLQFNLNNSYSVEPRVGLSYKVKPNQTLSVGVGVHSKIESLLDYTTNITDTFGNTYQPNKDLQLPKSNHYVLGYDFQFSENAHIKAEVYYQYLYDVPVENNSNSTYSTINQSEWSANKDLVNEGNGRNYGLELTIERYFADNFYYLLTGSFYESEYKTLNDKWIKTRFNGNYNGNFLLGKEFRVGKAEKNKSLLLSVKVGLQGGNRYNPIDLDQSIIDGETAYVDEVYSEKGDDVFYANIAGSYRVNRKKTSHEFKLEFTNLTNNKAKVTEYYNDNNRKIEVGYQLPMIPNIMYILSF
tara:strand:+ start:5480 stop:7825 length:2346 start_codon:yes stop_codon:yes gene_type:complete